MKQRIFLKCYKIHEAEKQTWSQYIGSSISSPLLQYTIILVSESTTNSGNKVFIFSYNFNAILHHWWKQEQELKAVTCKQELKQKPWMTAAFWCLPYGLLNLLSHTTRTTCPGMASPTVSWVKHSHRNQYINYPPKTCLKANLMEALSPSIFILQADRTEVQVPLQESKWLARFCQHTYSLYV